MSKTTIPTGGITADAIDGTLIADDAINSEHYTDGSIDTAHIGDSQVTAAKTSGVGGAVKLLQAKSTSATSYLIHDNVFSATYDFYKIIGYTNASAVDGNLRFRWRSGGSEVNGSYYRGAGYGMNLNTSGSESSTLNVARYNDSKFDLTDTTNNNNNLGDFFEITVAGMFDRDEGLSATLQASINQFRSNSNYRQYQFGGFYANQGANENYDGFYLWYSNANVQYYSYAVYGFNK